MANEILELLKNKKLRAKVVQTMKDVYSYAGRLLEKVKKLVEYTHVSNS